MTTNEHQPTCRWHLTTADECEYRETHHYCPHPEHACSCAPAETVKSVIVPRVDDTERLDSLAKLAEFRERIIIDMRAHERGGFDVAIFAEGGTYLSGDGHETPLFALRGAIDQLSRGGHDA